MYIDNDFIVKLKNFTGISDIMINEPMKNHTSFKIGGPADVLLTPHSCEQISGIVKLCLNQGTPYYIIGNGSNLLVSDKGIRGVVIKLYKNISKIKVEDDIIECECGALLSKISNVALESGLSGVEFAAGIPGTVGGATAMNAGAYDGEMKNVVFETKYIDETGNICTVIGNGHEFGYRSSIFHGTKKIVIASKLKLDYFDKQKIKEKMEDYNRRRKDKQPLEMPSAGSVFKRPEGFFAGKLIEDASLKGYKVGGAMVSNKHCGFIVNTGNATAQDVIDLIEHIQIKVQEQCGVFLQTEIRVIGEK